MFKKHLIFSWLFILANTPFFATTYYIDATLGSDSNNGLTISTPWKTLGKIRFANPLSGNTYLLKRGEIWKGTQWYIDFSGAVGQSIIFDAYGTASDPDPIVTTITDINNANNSANWIETSPNIWTLSASIPPGRLFLDGIEYLRSSTLADVGMNDSQGAFGHWFFDSSTNLIYLYASQNPATLFTEIEGSAVFVSTSVFNTEYLTFKNIDFQGGSGAALGFYGCSNIIVQSCKLGKFANSGILVINTTVSGVDEPSHNNTFTNNIFDSGFTFSYGLGSERGCGDGIKLFYGAYDCVIKDNTFKNWAHNAVELLGTQSSTTGVNNNLIYDNQISAPDIPYAHALGADGISGKCQNNEFYRNNIRDCRTSSQINGNNNWVHHNIIQHMRNSPSKNQPTAHAFVLGVYGTDFVSENNRFDYNLIIDTDESAFLVRGYGFTNQVSGNSIRNNIIYQTGQAPYNNAYTEGTGLVIYDTNTNGVGPNTYQNNLFYNSLATTNDVFYQDISTYYSASQFNAQNGVDGNTVANNLNGDPLFTDLANENFLPQNTSPAVNAGIDVSLSIDYLLNPRVVGVAPDIGPLETDVLNPLPVELNFLRAEVLENQKVKLFWQTLSEVNSEKFEIQRSSNESDWEKIGEIRTKGNNNEIANYIFLDQNPPHGIIYYRLKQVDLDGKFDFSPIVSCQILKNNPLKLARLTEDLLEIISTGNWDWSKTEIQIIDTSGKILITISGNSEININTLSSGFYFILVKKDEIVETFRFQK
ncbi:MAG: T9SS type A sorting domain-containing protein [Saprospiraceae bacterium]